MSDSFDVKQFGRLFCWLGGDTGSARPANWNGPWLMHVAHIASGRGRAIRVDDRRAVVLLSPLAHDVHVSNSDRLPFRVICGMKVPTIDERHTLFIKKLFDPEFYDPEFLQSIWIGKLPEPKKPPQFWVDRLLVNQGIMM